MGFLSDPTRTMDLMILSAGTFLAASSTVLTGSSNSMKRCQIPLETRVVRREPE
jgi:hypothetical protein